MSLFQVVMVTMGLTQSGVEQISVIPIGDECYLNTCVTRNQDLCERFKYQREFTYVPPREYLAAVYYCEVRPVVDEAAE